jgi:hypothetical protein
MSSYQTPMDRISAAIARPVIVVTMLIFAAQLIRGLA